MEIGLAVHRELIERFVAETPDLAARLVRTEGIFSRAQGLEAENQLVSDLAPASRELLARMLQEVRRSAFFDALKILHEFSYQRELVLSVHGAEVPAEPYGYTLFEEYITVLDLGGWESLGG